MIRLTLLTVLIGFSVEILAETRYVDDVLYVPIRTGKTDGHRVLKVLKSGTRVQIIQDDTEAGLSEVKVGNKLTGWMKSRYLSKEIIARDKVIKLNQEIDTLTAQLKPLQENLKTRNKEIVRLKKENQLLSSDNKKLTLELESIKTVSADTIGTHNANNHLRTETEKLQKQLHNLTLKNSVLKDNTKNEGIKLGIAAIIVGIFLGLFLPYLKPRKKSSSSTIRLR